MAASPLARVRAMCLALPETTERLSHGAPSFFVRRACFVNYMDHHRRRARIRDAYLAVAPKRLAEAVNTHK
jgi:hypothetical protein